MRGLRISYALAARRRRGEIHARLSGDIAETGRAAATRKSPGVNPSPRATRRTATPLSRAAGSPRGKLSFNFALSVPQRRALGGERLPATADAPSA